MLGAVSIWHRNAARFNRDKRLRVGLLSSAGLEFFSRSIPLGRVDRVIFFDLFEMTSQRRDDAEFFVSVLSERALKKLLGRDGEGAASTSVLPCGSAKEIRCSCRTLVLQSEQRSRLAFYAGSSKRDKTRLSEKITQSSASWLAFMISELESLCESDKFRQHHTEYARKLTIINLELARRMRGRRASGNVAYVNGLKELQRRVKFALKLGHRPRRGESKIRSLKTNWRK